MLLFAPFGTNFSSTSYYLVVPSLGYALILSAFFISIYNKIFKIKIKAIKFSISILFFVMVVSVIFMDDIEIRSRFMHFLANGRAAHGQQVIQNVFKAHIKGVDRTNPTLFYFDTSDIPGEGPFYTEGFLSSFPFWMHFKDNRLIDGCLEVLYSNDYKQLHQYVSERDGEEGFLYRGVCVENGRGSTREMFYKKNNFYAFKIKSRDFIDIKDKLLGELDLIEK